MDSVACAKIIHVHVQYINDNAVQGRLSENKNYRVKYFRHKIFAIYGTLHFSCNAVEMRLSKYPTSINR